MALMFDDLPDPAQAAPQPPADQSPAVQPPAQAGPQDSGINFDDLPETPEAPPPPQTSMLGAAASGGIRGLGPAAGAIAGAKAGALLGTAVAPEFGGTIIGGIGGALVGGALGAAGQETLMQKLGLTEGGGILSDKYAQAAERQHPYAQFTGGLLPLAAAFTTGGPETAIAARVLSGGIFGGMEAGEELYNEGKVDVGKTAIAAAAGAILPEERAWVSRLGSQVARGLVTGRPGLRAPPEATADHAAVDTAQDITKTERGVAPENTPVKDLPLASAANIAEQDHGNSGKYLKGRTIAGEAGAGIEAGELVGAPSTTEATLTTAPSLDVQAALTANAPPKEAAPAPAPAPAGAPVPEQVPAPPRPAPEPVPVPERAQHVPVPEVAPREPPPAPIETGIAPKPAGAGAPVVRGTPLDVPQHIADVLNLPQVQEAIQGPVDRTGRVPYLAGASNGADMTTHIDSGVPTVAVLPGGNRFNTAEPLQIHEQTEKWVMDYLMSKGMKADEAYRVAHWDFAEPAEDAYYGARGIDPKVAEAWWNRQALASENAPITGTPKDLYKKPYPHSRVTEAFEGGESTPRPTTEMQQKAAELMRTRGAQEPLAPAKPGAEGGLGEPILAGAPNAPEVPGEAERAPEQAVQKPAPLSARQADVLDRLRKMEGGTEAAAALEKQPETSPLWEKAAKYVYSNAPEIRHKLGEGEEAVQTGGGSRGARKEAASAAVKSAFDKFKPGEDEDDQALLDRAKAAVAHAQEQYNGKNPVDRKEGYAPRVKPAAWQFVKKAQQLLANPSDAAIERFRTDEGLLRSGGAKDVQATTRIASDIDLNRKPTAELAGEAVPAETTGLPSRQTFEMMEPWKPGADESKPYIEASNELRSYINNLEDTDYQLLEGAYPDMRTVVETAGDPHRLQLQMESDLEGAQMRRPGVLEPVPAENAPTAKRVRITKAADITEPGSKASEGVSRKDLIAEYNRKLAAGELKTPPRVTPEELAAANDRVTDERTADGSLRGMINKVKAMAGDESGAGPVPPFMQAVFNPPMTSSAREASEALGDRFSQHILGLDNDRSLVRANTAAAPERSPSEWKNVYRAMEDRTVNQLPDALKSAYHSSVEPLRNARINDLRDLIDLNEKNPWLDMKLPKDLEAGVKDHVPRLREGKQIYDADAQPTANPLNYQGRTLSLWNGALEKRDYAVLDDGAGNRKVFQVGDGQATLYNNGATRTVDAPRSFKGDIGDTLTLPDGKTYTVDHATAREVTANVRTPTNEPVKYIENPVMAESQQFLGTRAVLRNAKLLAQVNKDPRYLANSTTDPAVARENGWIQTKLPQFRSRQGKQIYMDPRIAWAMDDFVRPGFNDSALDTVRNVGNGLMRTMFTLNPIVHPLNELNLWATGRGFAWLQPAAYRGLVEDGRTAMQSVWTQDGRQAYYREHGANLILPSVLNSDLVKNMANKFGYEAAQNPSLWDPITKHFGVDVPAVAKWLNQNSQKVMWGLSDMLLTQRIMENERNGMSVEEAIKDAHTFISSYRLDPTILGSRTIQKLISDPAVSFFGRYHGGLWQSYAHMFRNLATGTTEQRTQALGQLLVGAAITGIVGPLLNSAYQSATGNKYAKVNPRGLSTIPTQLWDIAHGGDFSEVTGNVFSPSIPIKTAIGAAFNTDPFTGNKIMQAGSGVGRNIVQESEWLARNLVPPLNQAETAMRGPDPDKLGAVLQRLAEDQFGLRNPNPQQQKYLAKRDIINRQNAQKRFKKPPGMAEDIYNRLVGR